MAGVEFKKATPNCDIRGRAIFEGGIAQAARALAATPLAPSLATLPAGTHLRLNAAIGAHGRVALLTPELTQLRSAFGGKADIEI